MGQSKQRKRNNIAIAVNIIYRDESTETIYCIDYPVQMGDFMYLYMENMKREFIPKEAIAKIECSVIIK